MRSLNCFIVTPKDGKRYDNTKEVAGVELSVSSSQEDHKFTQRVALVESIPLKYNGPIKDGDEIVVHHNTFRVMNDMRGKEKSSWSHLFGDKYLIDSGEVFAYRRNKGKWCAIAPFCFVEPIKSDGIESEEPLVGIMVYPNEDQPNIKSGDLVGFLPDSEYEFNIEGKKLYRMKTSMICLVRERES